MDDTKRTQKPGSAQDREDKNAKMIGKQPEDKEVKEQEELEEKTY